MNDILPDEVIRWQSLESTFRSHVELFGYGEVRTPLIEQTSLYVRQVGETTDMVEKEMYSFTRHEEALTVRPEGTAGMARAYVEHKVHNKEPVSRWYTIGAMFRGERPAKGRYRQFYQADCEIFGDPGPLADAELIELVAGFFRKLGIGEFVAHVSSLGSGETRQRYRQALLDYFSPMKDKLGDDSQRRLEKNPLRILDSKDPRDKAAAEGAPKIFDVLDGADRQHFEDLCHYLEVLGVPYVKDPLLVRGLDYYTRTVFEVKTSLGDLGAQNTLCAGGRYDNMVENLGGPKVPAIGFAMGIERLLTVAAAAAAKKRGVCFLAPLSPSGANKALTLAKELRAFGVPVELDGRGAKLKTMIRRADGLGARLFVILGDEADRGVATVKDLASHTQDEVPLDSAARVLADRIAASSDGRGTH